MARQTYGHSAALGQSRYCSPHQHGGTPGNWDNAPRCGGQDPRWDALSGGGDEERPMQDAWWHVDGPQDGSGHRAHPGGAHQARSLLGRSIARRREAREAIRTLQALLRLDPTAASDAEADES